MPNRYTVPPGWFALAKRNIGAVKDPVNRRQILNLMVKELERLDMKIFISEMGGKVMLELVDWPKRSVIFVKSDGEKSLIHFDQIPVLDIRIEQINRNNE